jgi:hypothetical protein
MGLKIIEEKDMDGLGVIGMADTPRLSARKMQEKVEEIVRKVVIPTMNLNAENTATLADVQAIVTNSGGGDMYSKFYDKNSDGSVNSADNGINTYEYIPGTPPAVTCSGENGKFKCTADLKTDKISLNGETYAVNFAGRDTVTLKKGSRYLFSVDSEGKTINFFDGGGGINCEFTTVKPPFPKENTIFIKDGTDIENTTLSFSQPKRAKIGDLWCKLGSGKAEFYPLEGENLILSFVGIYQYDGENWQEKKWSVFSADHWIDSGRVLVPPQEGDTWQKSGGVGYSTAENIFIAEINVPASWSGAQWLYLPIDIQGQRLKYDMTMEKCTSDDYAYPLVFGLGSREDFENTALKDGITYPVKTLNSKLATEQDFTGEYTLTQRGRICIGFRAYGSANAHTRKYKIAIRQLEISD